MSEWLRIFFDVVLIGVVSAGLVQAARLIRHLANLKQGRIDMERFVHEFNATVIRAETGIKGLRMAARESGDDLEKLVEKAVMVRDELHFIVESADNIANRLSNTASNAVRPTTEASTPSKPATTQSKPAEAAPALKPETTATAQPTSRAEKELLQALQKLS